MSRDNSATRTAQILDTSNLDRQRRPVEKPNDKTNYDLKGQFKPVNFSPAPHRGLPESLQKYCDDGHSGKTAISESVFP